MPQLRPGLYETLLTELNAAGLNPSAELRELLNAEAPDRIALHVAVVLERAIQALPERERAAAGVQIAQRLIDQAAAASASTELLQDRPISPATVLHAIPYLLPDGRPAPLESPLIPLLDTTLLTNSPGEPSVGTQILAEIASANRIDVVMAFIRRSGIMPLKERLKRHVESGRRLRVLTTIYTGSTELEALEILRELGAEIRISYDTTSTRLHAKAWMFHRDTGFSTAYVGSSNLTHSAQVSGLEWNVRISSARNRPVIEKIGAVFESYWENPDFSAYEKSGFLAACSAERSASQITLSPVEIRLEPFQERLLELVEVSRLRGHRRNLLVSATGTGKTVMAAIFFARLRASLPRARLLFVAHRTEILEQSRATFAHALREAGFGELWNGGRRPVQFEHVFASIQSLAAHGITGLTPDHFDVVIIDEFHHAGAETYVQLLRHLCPKELLGLTATPERSDGVSVLSWFDGRIAAELRLWDAIDQQRLAPFSYFGVADELDLREIPWRRGAGYDVDELTNLITSTDSWARRVLHQFMDRVGRIESTRTLGFCVSVAHAQYMARIFRELGVRAAAVWSETKEEERRAVLQELGAGRLNVVFSVDLFNEGVDVPAVDTLLMLRPTESPTLFLQQLGRGLRKSPGKTSCVVLDFVGQHRREFRYDLRFRALFGGSRNSVIEQIERGFPFLPAGCHLELDRVATERVLQSIRDAVPRKWTAKADELRVLELEHGPLALGRFLELSGLELTDVYSADRSWSDLREAANSPVSPAGPHERQLRAACGRLLHVDDAERLETWIRWLAADAAPQSETLTAREHRLLLMLLVQLLDQVADPAMTLESAVALIWSHQQIRRELKELAEVLLERINHATSSLEDMIPVPLRVGARYTRQEILSACGVNPRVKKKEWREGVFAAETIGADLLVFTLDKTSGGFSPTTRYRDYAISRDLLHWESQSMTRAESPTGQRYRSHVSLGRRIFLFGRHSSAERSFYFMGPATYVSHQGECPMAVTWRLKHSLPGDLFQSFAAAVA